MKHGHSDDAEDDLGHSHEESPGDAHGHHRDDHDGPEPDHVDHDGHGHGHHHHPNVNAAKGRAFAIGVGLNVTFVVVEVFYGVVAHSMALLADAAHNLSDVLGLLMAWAALRLATQKPSLTHTYGFRRATVLAALFNALLLVATVGGVAWEAFGRLQSTQPVEGGTLIAVAGVGVLVNGVSAMFFFAERGSDANIRGAFLHLAADAAVSVGVVGTGIVILKTGMMWLDPAVSIAVSVVILYGTWGLLKEVTHLLLDAVPPHVDIEKVRAYLESLPGVEEVHDLHVWSMSTTEVALTAHLVMPWRPTPPTFFASLSDVLAKKFRIHHSTIQLEPTDATGPCHQAPDDVV